jgi:sphingomyelin phosphodiesterase acid-like 3
MKTEKIFVWLRVVAYVALAVSGASGFAQVHARSAAANTAAVQALFVSDIHFDPFWDPAKATRLASAPVAEWKGILAAPEPADRQAQWEAVEKKCPTRGEDTNDRLLISSLHAIRERAASAKFAVVSGDLIAHSFPCKFAAVFPGANPGDYRAFVEKTIEFVMGSLRETLPGVPVYAELGNNDSDCADNWLDANSDFLSALGQTMIADLPAAERGTALKDFAAEGDYSAKLPAPMKNARMLALDDLFLARKYQSCGGKADAAPAEAQIAWLKAQLDAARQNKEQVWVMAHIPPGVDAYATASKGLDLCAEGKAQMFLSSNALNETLAAYSDVIRLVIFGHTHMDELRLLAGAGSAGIATKLVASISPVDGNNPSFTVAQIDAATATLKDYRVIAASDNTGTAWSEEYDFDQAYNEPAFTAANLGNLITGFKDDPGAKTSASQNYIRSYGTGMGAKELSLFWPLYVCSLTNNQAEPFRGCVCGMLK